MVVAVMPATNTKQATQGGSHTKAVRPPLLPSDSGNAVASRLPKGREVSSRYAVSSSASYSTPKRCASPLISRKPGSTAGMTPVEEASSAVKRAQSVERRQVVAARLNTLDLRLSSNVNYQSVPAQKVTVTCTRSLAVSFQGQSFSFQVSKTKPSPAPSSVRKATPERRKQPPMATGVLGQANHLGSYLDYTDQRTKLFGSGGNVVRSLHDSIMSASLDSDSTDYQKEAAIGSDSNAIGRSIAQDYSTVGSDGEILPPNDSNQQDCVGLKGISSSPKVIASTKASFNSPILSPTRRLPSPDHRMVQAQSPSKLVAAAASMPTRGMSPSRVRSAVAGILSSAVASNMPSIWSFAADLRRGRIAENRIVDAHELRILYNRHLQWRFVNAREDSSLNAQELDALRSLYSTWIITTKLRKSVRAKRMELQRQQRNLKLTSILQGQMPCLESLETMDQDYSGSLSGATEALRASTLRLPVIGGARADIQRVKDAICSAAEVMQAMASNMCFLQSKVEALNSTVVEVANVAAKESALLNQSTDILSAVAALQVKEYSLRAHNVQLTTSGRKV